MQELAEDQRDLIAEMMNLGAGKAAAGLGEKIGEEVLLSVPNVYLASRQAVVADFLSRASSEPSRRRLIVVMEKFSGGLEGEALLVLSAEDGRSLATLQQVREGSGADHRRPARFLAEIGGAVLNSCLGEFSEALGLEILIEPPVVEEGDAADLLLGLGEGADLLFVSLAFSVGRRSLAGHLLVVLDRRSIGDFLAGVDSHLVRLSCPSSVPPP